MTQGWGRGVGEWKWEEMGNGEWKWEKHEGRGGNGEWGVKMGKA